ncbi:hypothetical protein SAMN02927921_01451 [Sinomicrobium oceani]|uniref:MBOAT, membrane-bound O-acyltransferase family n=1 Tax=Sinomicrobium oceani TaxID=1150368 RepID=A0A1K1NU47_9FLAO|nr:hypothetical protein [Sinomicrobium oceani]SFW38801.1 hypothetical protein SAMN02927921_01451 [Sinomicrobium oceani]
MTLTAYIKKRNGVSVGSPMSLRNNLYRSLGARNFSTFWNYWNPIFGYYLGHYLFKPLKRIFPVPVALVLTFTGCGLIHDGVTMLFRGGVSLFFTIWFLVMGLAVLGTRYLNHNFAKQKWGLRALVNISIISACFLITVYINLYIPV